MINPQTSSWLAINCTTWYSRQRIPILLLLPFFSSPPPCWPQRRPRLRWWAVSRWLSRYEFSYDDSCVLSHHQGGPCGNWTRASLSFPPHNAKVFPLEAIRFTELTTTPEDPDRWILCRASVGIGTVYRLPRGCHGDKMQKNRFPMISKQPAGQVKEKNQSSNFDIWFSSCHSPKSTYVPRSITNWYQIPGRINQIDR